MQVFMTHNFFTVDFLEKNKSKILQKIRKPPQLEWFSQNLVSYFEKLFILSLGSDPYSLDHN